MQLDDQLQKSRIVNPQAGTVLVDSFGSELRFIGYPGNRSRIFAPVVFSIIGKDTDCLALFQCRKLVGRDIGTQVKQVGVGYFIQRLTGGRHFTRFSIFNKNGSCLGIYDTAFL